MALDLGFTTVTLAFAGRVVLYSAVFGLAYFFYNLYQVRMLFRRARKEYGVHMLPHSFLFGHLLVFAKVAIKRKLPRDLHGAYTPLWLALEYPEIAETGLVYMDPWPIAPPTLAVFDPDMMTQFTAENSQLKHPNVNREFLPFAGGTDLVTSDGLIWKTARLMFNPGFAVKNLMSLVPGFVEEAVRFREVLGKMADKGDVVPLEKATTNVTVDIIGRAVLGERLGAQDGGPVPLLDAMLEQLSLLYFNIEPGKWMNPMNPYRHWRLNRKFRQAALPRVENAVRNYEKLEGPKTIIQLAVKAFVEEHGHSTVAAGIPAHFVDGVITQLKIFLLAGHDTTATTLAYAYYLLSCNPDKLALLRAEVDEVLGADAATKISQDPALLNRLPYAQATIKETLRLFPPLSSVRLGGPGFELRGAEGQRYPAEGFMLLSNSVGSHRSPRWWRDPHAFVPERFLGDAAPADLRPVKNGFRAFEMGPRNCIGQELAGLELRLILALTVREFDFEAAYPEGAETFLGERAYQVQPPALVTAHPKGGLPVRIRRRRA